jgi:hypothetical protein
MIRSAEWGNWGITFFTRNHASDYAPSSIAGTLYFPVGARGPMDGFVGSPERQRYQAVIAAWQQRGELPDGIDTSHAF